VIKRAGELLRAAGDAGLDQLPRQRRGQRHLQGQTDVVVCDGFVGNVLLKTSEGLAGMLGEFIRQEFTRNPLTKLAALVALPVLKHFKARVDPRRYNGAALLGCGAWSSRAMARPTPCLRAGPARAYDAARNRLLDRVHDRIAQTAGAGTAQAGPAGDARSRNQHDRRRRLAAAGRLTWARGARLASPAANVAYSRITGTGSTLPPRRISNTTGGDAGRTRRIETSDDWIVERTGIRARWFRRPRPAGQRPGPGRARQALRGGRGDAGRSTSSSSPHRRRTWCFPSTACILQHKLGVAGCPAFDVQAVCSGFVYALTVADAMIRAGGARALVIGAEVFSRLLDFNDRTTCVLFGDGAGAVVLEPPTARHLWHRPACRWPPCRHPVRAGRCPAARCWATRC
jgi:hypothetical protein